MRLWRSTSLCQSVFTVEAPEVILNPASTPGKSHYQTSPFCGDSTCPVCAVGSNGRCNTIWYKAVFKGGVYETRETVWAFSRAEERRVASLEVGADVA